MKYITVKLTEDQAEDIVFNYGNMFYDYLEKDNQYAHFCHRLRIKVQKALNLAKS